MPPKFTLQPVLEYRHNHVEILEVELGRIMHLHQEANQMLLTLEQRQQNLTQELTGSQKEGEIDLQKVGQLRNTLRRLAGRIAQQKQRIEELICAEETKRLDLVAAKQGEEALETLKDKEVARYRAKVTRQENSMQDDIYISRAYRRSIEGELETDDG
jgi:flagellar export protein FliJ